MQHPAQSSIGLILSDIPSSPHDPGFGWCPPGKVVSTHLFHFPTEDLSTSQPLLRTFSILLLRISRRFLFTALPTAEFCQSAGPTLEIVWKGLPIENQHSTFKMLITSNADRQRSIEDADPFGRQQFLMHFTQLPCRYSRRMVVRLQNLMRN